MTFVLLYTVMLAMRGFSVSAAVADRSECGVRSPMSRRNTRTSNKYQHQQHQQQHQHHQPPQQQHEHHYPPPFQYNNQRAGRIIDGSPTREGQFPWQVSLELLHPSLGFIGHWCGAVLIDQYWVLSAAHCIHNDLFNLPLPPLWTVVLGEFNRHVESGFEQRVSVDRIVMHQDYENYQHDLVMIKLAEPADMGASTTVRKICLPFIAFNYPQSVADSSSGSSGIRDEDDTDDRWSVPTRDHNFLRSIQLGSNRLRGHTNHTNDTDDRTSINKRSGSRRGRSNVVNHTDSPLGSTARSDRRLRRPPSIKPPPQQQQPHRRRNDKFMHGGGNDGFGSPATEERRTNTAAAAAASAQNELIDSDEPPLDLPYVDCIATGWGKATISGDLTDILLQTRVPIHPNAKCTTAYGENVRIHRGHLCAGKLNGKGGTCVGDSGGPLQCRISKNGPWMLAGVTSFGSGCAEQGYPDVYSRISHYVQWIMETMDEDAAANDATSDYDAKRRRRFGK